jgi:hypothetical protein
MGIVLAMLVTAPVVVVVQTDGTAPCDTKAFARALATLRPDLQIVSLDSTSTVPAGAWRARIEGLGFAQATLQVSGSATPLQRSLAGQECARALETAASIVDGLLEQLPDPASERTLSLAPPQRPKSLSVLIGVGFLQSPIQSVAAFALGTRLGLGQLELVGSIDVGLQASIPLATEDEGPVGTYHAVPVDLEVGAGWGPRLGPGRLSLDGLVGVVLANVWTTAAAGAPKHLFDAESKIATAAYLAASASYVFDLPARFFVGVRIEERLSPEPVTVSVDGAVASDRVVTRVWSFTATGLLGWRLF